MPNVKVQIPIREGLSGEKTEIQPNARSYCKHCGRGIRYVDQLQIGSYKWIHIDEYSGLLRGEQCYYTPTAEPDKEIW